MIHCERKKNTPNPHRRKIKWCASVTALRPKRSRAGTSGMRSVGASAGHGRKVPETARRLRMETASAQTGKTAGVLTSKIYQQLATLSKLGWIGKDVTFNFIYRCRVWNSYSKVFPLSLLKKITFSPFMNVLKCKIQIWNAESSFQWKCRVLQGT